MSAEAADRLERERYGRVVREYRPAFDRAYLDLLDVADATCRAHDKPEEKTA